MFSNLSRSERGTMAPGRGTEILDPHDIVLYDNAAQHCDSVEGIGGGWCVPLKGSGEQ